MVSSAVTRQTCIAATGIVAALAGLEAMYAAFLVWGAAPPRPAVSAGLTMLGASLYRPERELPIYALGILATVAVALGAARRGGVAAPDGVRAAWSVAVATVSACGFLVLCLAMPRQVSSAGLPPICVLVLLAGLVAAWLATALLGRRGPPAWFRDALSEVDCKTVSPDRIRAGAPLGAIDAIVAAGIIAVVFVPNTAALAGLFYRLERLHHWDYFIVGPALGYMRGGSLGATVYSQYGVGFPALFALTALGMPRTYGNVVRAAVLLACAYYVALYGLLRALLRSRGWAILGLLLALDLQLFQGVELHEVLWRYPSSTVIRSPLDVLVLGSLLWDSRSKGGLPLATASLLAGLAVLLETDTGAYLAVAIGVYSVLTRVRARRPDLRPLLRVAPALVAPGVVALLAGLEVAARGRALDGRFLAGWLEVFRLYPSGIGMLPINMFTEGILLSYIVIGLYLVVVCRAAALWRAGRVTPANAVSAAIAVYGLCYLCQFIGRSHPFNLYHSCIPAVILTALGLREVSRRAPALLLDGRLAAVEWSRAAAPALLSAATAIHILSLHGFADYPNVLHPGWEQAHGL